MGQTPRAARGEHKLEEHSNWLEDKPGLRQEIQMQLGELAAEPPNRAPSLPVRQAQWAWPGKQMSVSKHLALFPAEGA